MPIIKSAQKAMRQNKTHRQRNLVWKDKIKELKKSIDKLIENGKVEDAKKLISQYYKTIDKAAKNNILKKNTAARRKSKIVKSLLDTTPKAKRKK
jgi:small subunit ribosomal protein S20